MLLWFHVFYYIPRRSFVLTDLPPGSKYWETKTRGSPVPASGRRTGPRLTGRPPPGAAQPVLRPESGGVWPEKGRPGLQ